MEANNLLGFGYGDRVTLPFLLIREEMMGEPDRIFERECLLHKQQAEVYRPATPVKSSSSLEGS